MSAKDKAAERKKLVAKAAKSQAKLRKQQEEQAAKDREKDKLAASPGAGVRFPLVFTLPAVAEFLPAPAHVQCADGA